MVKITQIPAGEATFDRYAVTLDGQPAEVYAARVSAVPHNRVWPGKQRGLDQTEIAGFLTFAMDAPVTVTLTAKTTPKEVVVRPLSKGVVPVIDGKTITLTVKTPGQYTVEANGMHEALHIFADPLVDYDLSPDDPDVVYFGAGVHHPGQIELHDNQTLYLDQDAVVYGNVLAFGAKNVRILGHGILDGSKEVRTSHTLLLPFDLSRTPEETITAYNPCAKLPGAASTDVPGSVILRTRAEYDAYTKEHNLLQGCVRLIRCEDCTVGGIVCRDAASFTILLANCTDCVCDNVKLIGMWRYNSDGIDLFNCRGCVIRDSFLRNFDDCVVLKGIVGWDTWNMEDILVERCVVWCDWGRNLEIGAETCAPAYKNITFRDCDCIHCAHVAMDLQCADRADVHDVVFDNIRVEYSKYDVAPIYQNSDDEVFVPKPAMARLFVSELYCNVYSNDGLLGHVHDITLREIRIFTDAGQGFPPIVIRSADEDHRSERIRFSRVFLNGTPVTSMENLPIQPAEFTRDVTWE